LKGNIYNETLERKILTSDDHQKFHVRFSLRLSELKRYANLIDVSKRHLQ